MLPEKFIIFAVLSRVCPCSLKDRITDSGSVGPGSIPSGGTQWEFLEKSRDSLFSFPGPADKKQEAPRPSGHTALVLSVAAGPAPGLCRLRISGRKCVRVCYRSDFIQ